MARVPSSDEYAAALEAIRAPKLWVSSRAMSWVSNGSRLPGYKLRAPLAFSSAPRLQLEGLFLDAYYKDSTIPGVPAKLSVVLAHRNSRILALDTNGPSNHYNKVGIGLPFYHQRVDHPHLHLVVQDAFEGYAEPLVALSNEDHWNDFMQRANISGHPGFQAPTGQLVML